MRVTYCAILRSQKCDIQLLFVMVLSSALEVDWKSVSSAVEKDEVGKNPFGDVKDRSLSYLDLEEQLIFRENRIFESVRKYGRPRQQINDFLIFKDFDESFIKGKSCDRYHFGQCLVLPKISTLPPKEKPSYYNGRRTRPAEKSRHVKCCPVCFKTAHSIKQVKKIEDKMYRWADTMPGNFPEKSFEDDNLSLKSGRVNTKRDYGDFYADEDDVEAQTSRSKKLPGKNLASKDEYYCSSTLKRGSRKTKTEDEVVVLSETKIPDDFGENWEVKAAKANEMKQTRRERRKSSPKLMEEDEEWEMPIVNPSWRVIEEYVKKELHRSKSTPDMLVGNKRNLEVWKGDDKPKRNGSMVNMSARTLAVYNDQQEADSLNDPQSLQEAVSATEAFETDKRRNSKFASGKSFFGQFLTSRVVTPTADMFSDTEPFSQFWVKLSNIYGQTLIILMVSFILTEVMDNSVNLLSLQGIFLMYLYVGSIAVIICIYIWVLIDSCSSIQNDSRGLVPPTITTTIVLDRGTDLQNISPSKFGSLKKAHISRDRTSNTSFYLRIGAIAFGLGTLVFNGLEMAMHSMMEGSCLNDVVFIHPILHGLFTFLQMHFLFVNSQVLVERFGLAARFGFMHLAATNLALWIRLVIWDSGNEWTHYIHLKSDTNGRGSDVPTPLHLRGFPKSIVAREKNFDSGGLAEYQTISNGHVSQVVALHQCLNSNSLGQLWTSSMPFLYPFIIQFSIIAAAVTYIMGQNVAKDHLFFQKQKKGLGPDGKGSTLATLREGFNSWGVDCSGASKGLFLGILCLVTGIVVIIIFLVVKENDDFPPDTIFWLTNGTLLTILSITLIMNIVGLIQIRKLSVIGTKMSPLDKILMALSILGVQLYTLVSIVVGGAGVKQEESGDSSLPKRNAMLLSVSIIQITQIILQSCFVVEGIRRKSLTRTQIITKPARQVITFLIFSNAVLWAFDSFVIQSWMSQELQLRFFGILTWGVISRIGLPLLVFFRFHSCVLLLEIWKKSYQSLSIESGN